jgi:phosphopantothenoylcysteine synthetase/decarboxylase
VVVPSFGSGSGNVLYLIVCAAPPASESGRTIAALQDAGWDVCVVATPAALAWIDSPAISKATGHPVRSDFRGPDEPEFAPRGDAVLVAPATFNTINKVAVGLNDTLALGLINEAIGSQSVPVALVPWVNPSLRGHPAYHPSLSWLRSVDTHIVELAAHDPKAFDEAIAATSDWLVTTASGSAHHPQ